MTIIEYVTYGLGGFLVVVAIVYVLARVITLAHFRSKSDYDRGFFRKFLNGDTTDGL